MMGYGSAAHRNIYIKKGHNDQPLCYFHSTQEKIRNKKVKFVKNKVMSTVELRHMIIEKLSLIDDVSFLKAIKTIIESKAEERVYQLSNSQKKRIEAGREQARKGKTISHDALQKEVTELKLSKHLLPEIIK
jgi:hypothetical protein